MTFANYLATTAQDIEKSLTEFLITWEATLTQKEPSFIPLLTALRKQSEGGKRLRGVFVRLGYTLGDGDTAVYNAVLHAATALEIFQTAILIHDDIIDKSPLRRGKPSLYSALGGDHYAISQAISLGDVGFFLTTELMAELPVSDEKKIAAIRIFSHAMQQTALGEMLDVSLPREKTYSEANILTIARYKTAYYSFIAPLSIGYVLGNGKTAELKKLQAFGEHLGIAFQIQDDILGVFAEEKTLGKSNTSDITEGKRTLLLWYANEHASTADKEQLALLYGKPTVTVDEMSIIQNIFTRSGAREYAHRLSKERTEQARALLKQLPGTEEAKWLVSDMIDYLLERTH